MAKWRGWKPKYRTAKAIKRISEEYFLKCEEEGKCPTITELAYMLGMDRRNLLEYEHCIERDKLKSLRQEDREEISETLKVCRRYIEACYENRAVEAKNPAFHIFALKNFGWQDKVVQEVTQREIKVTLEDDEE